VRFIVGLGNPGLAYRFTRHNLGFMVIDRLARKRGISLSKRRFRARYGEGEIGSERVILFKPQTYVNLSGSSIRDLLFSYRGSLSRLIAIHDDLDLSFGRIRITRGGGHGGHRGVQSILESLGRSDFVRLKIGIGRPGEGIDPKDYVLETFIGEEREQLTTILSWAVDGVETILLRGVERAMNRFNVAEICEKKDS